METFDFISQNPALFIIISSVFVFFIVVILILGGKIKTPWFEITPKKDIATQQHNYSPHITQTPSIQQSPHISIYPESPNLSREQMDELVKRISENVITIRNETNKKPSNYLYQPPTVPEHIQYIYLAQYDIEKKLQKLVFGMGGGWPGSSMATWGHFLEIAKDIDLIPEQFGNEIADFFSFTQVGINSGNFSDEMFLDIQYLATKINRDLDHYIKDLEENPESLIYQRKKAEQKTKNKKGKK